MIRLTMDLITKLTATAGYLPIVIIIGVIIAIVLLGKKRANQDIISLFFFIPVAIVSTVLFLKAKDRSFSGCKDWIIYGAILCAMTFPDKFIWDKFHKNQALVYLFKIVIGIASSLLIFYLSGFINV